jgi:hypothetical protein
MKFVFSLAAVCGVLFLCVSGSKAATTPVALVSTGAVWKYLDNGSDQGTAWRAPGFNDSSWASGPAELGYGDAVAPDNRPEATVIGFGPNMNAKYTNYYFRHSFTVANISQLSNLEIGLLRDDGAVVYLNGTEVFRQNMPAGPITSTTTALNSVGGVDEATYFTNAVSASFLVEGLNVLAVEVHQNNGTSSDISFDLGFYGLRTTGNAAPTVSITFPTNNATFIAPANVTITANASDSDGSVTNVAFYQGAAKLGDDATSPFSVDWNNVTAGSYALTAVATDSGGLSTTSAVVNVKVDPGSTSIPLIPLASSWKYMDNGSDQGSAWTAIAFDDSSWSSGAAQLGYGDGDEATIVGSGPDPQNKYITTYFRRTFNVANPASFQDLVLRLMRDDGAVVYLNGTEVVRSNMPPGSVNYLTLATVGVTGAEESAFFTNIVSASGLVTGANVVAVEIHQNLGNSTDISFELELIGRTTGSVSNATPTATITSPSNGATVVAPVAISANASDSDGSVTLVEFYANGAKIGEDATSPYQLSWPATAGGYALRAVATDNQLGRGTSAVVNITVTGNVAPTVSITSPTNNANFVAPTNVTIQATAADSDGSVTNVEFFVGNTKIGEDNASPYSIIWSNVVIGSLTLTAVAKDNAGASTVSAPVTVNFTGEGPTTLVASNSVWKYLDDGSDQGSGWTALGFDDTSWLSGPAELGYGDTPDGRPEATMIGFGPNPNAKYITYYFRHVVNVSNPSRFSFLTLGLMRDDGGVVYLNGTEVFRSNMPQGPINYLTPASGSIPNSDEFRFFTTTVNANLLVPGQNIVAVEIHQRDGTSSDVSFDLYLLGQTGAISNNLPAVAITSPTDGSFFTDPANININVTASDSDGGVTKVEFYQGTTKLAEDSTAPYNFVWSGVGIGNYQLRAVASDNLGGVSTSAVVNVSVIASSKPTIASVNPTGGSTLSNLTQVTVNFSEPVSGVDAADLLVNGVPTTSVSGSNAVYTFSFPQQLEGTVAFTWRANHGIADFESPPKSFDEFGAGASWQYQLADNVRPTVIALRPAAGATIDKLSEIRVTFSEAVGGIQPGDLLVNGLPATGLTGSGAGPYQFQFPPPSNGNVTVAWTNNHGIHDFAATQNTFAGGSWTYTLNTNLVESVIVINEIMYHPSSELNSEEYIEIFSRTNVPINLTGWRFSGGINFTFPNVSIPSNGFLVVAADTNAFRAKYPGVTNVIGNWTGTLANSGEDIDLDNANGDRADSVHYADEGEWAVRQQIAFGGFNGWVWSDEHDGGGKSLELIRAMVANDRGQNWAASIPNNGTPGALNSVRTNNIAPLILDAQHFPAVPKSTNTVIISARLQDEQTTGVSGTLFYRDHTTTSPGGFLSLTMFDDGAHSDGVAGDGVFAASIPPQANGTIIEFYIQASDAQGLMRTWPAPARLVNQTFSQEANALYQVDDEVPTSSMPFYRIVMTATERDRLWAINGGNNAEMNATFISMDGTSTKVRYNLGMRHRGAGSRGVQPYNFRINVPSDRRWNGYEAFDLNAHFPHSHIAGNALARKSGLVCEDPVAVQVRINGNNEAGPIGAYVWLEDIGTDWANNHFPDDPDGNAYRCTRPSANLSYRGTNPQTYINDGYSKQSNVGENDWSDLINLTDVLNNTPDGDYTRAVRQRIDVEEWVRAVAVLSMLGYGETSILSDGQPDDFSMYRGMIDTRFLILAHDHDTDLGEGDSPVPVNRSIFASGANPTMNRLLTWPEFTPLYYAELKRLCDTTFTPLALANTLEHELGSWVASDIIERMRNYGSNRVTSVLSQIQTSFALNVGLPIVNGYYQAGSASVALNGTASVITTRSVKVNGQFASWSHISGNWNITLPLRPGINTVTVQALDGSSKVVNETAVEVWYDDGSVASVSGTLTGANTWTAAGGPYNVTANLTIGGGATLTIQPGTTVYLNNGVNITVANGGQLTANGTESARIRFGRAPGVSANWGGITVNGGAGSPETRIAYAHFDGNGSTAIHSSGGTLFLDHLTFGNTGAQYLSLDGSSFVVQDCVFPTATAQFELVHGTGGIKAGGRGIFMRNFFGVTIGYNDVVDFTGGNRPGPIVQFLDNVFVGATDDILDLDSTDAWIEHNIFLHTHKNGSPDSASAVSGGADNPDTSQITIIGNIIYDCDQAANAKQGNFYTLLNNTIVRTTKQGGTDTNSAVALLSDVGTAEGAGMYLEGNIIYDAEKLVAGQTASIVTLSNNIIYNLQGPAWTGPGGNNVQADPLFKRLPQLSETTFTSWSQAQVLWDWFSLQTGSPATGTGPNGRDKGGVIPVGVSISGEPVGITSDRSATLQIGLNRTGSGIPTSGFPNGSGYTHYRWRLDGGAWSAETPTATPISLTSLANGPHVVQVAAKRDSGLYQDDTEFGSEALITASRQWTVNTGIVPLRINEVLAANNLAVPVGGRSPDLIELYNPSSTNISLTGMSLTDDADNPFKFRFPAGASIAAGQYLLLYADNETTPPGHHLGFSIKQEGDDLYLFTSDGRLVDSVVFGPQLTDLSIGRLADGTWALTRPTFGSANVAERVGDVRAIKINEWLTDEFSAASDDFIELFNPNSLPVDLGGRYLSDRPFGAPTRHRITPLSFIPAVGFLVFKADGNAGAGADHVNFKLAPEQGMIGLTDLDLSLIDCILYGQQFTDISQGRQPNGGSTIVYFDTPTPGAPNPGIIIPNQSLTINEVLAFNTDIKYTNVIGGVTIINTPDFVELYNPSGSAVSLNGMSLSDDPLNARKYVFTNGLSVPALGYFVIRCDADVPVSASNTGFGLSQGGNVTLTLYDSSVSELSKIKFGIQAANYSIGRVPNGGSNWVLNVVTLGRANAAVPSLGNGLNLKINEWMANPASGDDWFEVYNPNSQPVAIDGYYLTDQLSTPTKSPIHPLSFIGIEAYGYQQFRADGNTAAGADHVNFSLRAAGEELGIAGPNGIIFNGTNFLAQDVGVSEGRLPDGSSTIVRFPSSASPGDANYLPLPTIVINEVLSHTDVGQNFEDAIEVFNAGATQTNISGWYLSDSRFKLKKYQIPNNTRIDPRSFKVFYENQFNFDPTNNGNAFALNSAKGDEVYLAQAVGGNLTGYRASVKFGAAENIVSFGRYTNSVGQVDFVAMSRTTFGRDNPDSLTDFRLGTGLPNAGPKVGPVVIGEIMYHPPDINGTTDDVLGEYVELRNITTSPVPLYHPSYPSNRWQFRDGINFTFPPNTTIPAGETLLVVSFDPVNDTNSLAAFRAKYSLGTGVAMVGPYNGKLDNGGEELGLYKPDAPEPPGDPDAGFVPYILVDRVVYSDSAPWMPGADGTGLSLTRVTLDEYGNDPANWSAQTPTPGPQGGNPDRDGDGMPNTWEQQYGLNPDLYDDWDDDPDHDGAINLYEYLAGTDPTSAASVFELLISGTGPVTLRFSAVADKTYTVLYRNSLTAGSWLTLTNVPAGPARIVQFTDPTGGVSRFYRLRTPAQ